MKTYGHIVDFNNPTALDRYIIGQRLRAPFLPACYSFKPTMVSYKTNSATPLIAIDSRIACLRLDQVFGIGNWSTHHETKTEDIRTELKEKKEYGKVVESDHKPYITTVSTVTIDIHCGQINLSTSNVGDNSDWLYTNCNSHTSAWAQGFKRTASNIGVGAFLYEFRFDPLPYSNNSFSLSASQVKDLLDNLCDDALNTVGFDSVCEITGDKIGWYEAALSMSKFGAILSKKGVQSLKN